MAQASHILSERGQSYYWKGAGALSIKCFFNGEAFYDTGLGRYRVDGSSYLVLNQERTYSIEIDSETPVESFCIFFADGFAEESLYSLSTTTEKLLDQPGPALPPKINFFEKTYAHDQTLSPALFGLRKQIVTKATEPPWIQEQLHEIMRRLLSVHVKVKSQADALPAVRASSREELYRRLSRARDFARASFDQRVTLNEMAQVACLSPTHFLRTFKHAFHQTPHQYLTARRLAEAQRLLLETDRRVTDICLAVGFSSLSSFSWMFRRHVGQSPEEYRLRKR